MPSRDRVFAALEFRDPDGVPVEHHASPAGFLEHGEKLRALWLEDPGDAARTPPAPATAGSEYEADRARAGRYQPDLILSLAMWRRFSRPRYEGMIRRINAGSAKVFLRRCSDQSRFSLRSSAVHV